MVSWNGWHTNPTNKKSYSPPFISYQFQRNDNFNRGLSSECTGTSHAFTERKCCRRIFLPFPKPPEQRTIATALSDADAHITSLDQLIAKKRDIKQAAMQELLTGKRRLPGFKNNGFHNIGRVVSEYCSMRDKPKVFSEIDILVSD